MVRRGCGRVGLTSGLDKVTRDRLRTCYRRERRLGTRVPRSPGVAQPADQSIRCVSPACGDTCLRRRYAVGVSAQVARKSAPKRL